MKPSLADVVKTLRPVAQNLIREVLRKDFTVKRRHYKSIQLDVVVLTLDEGARRAGLEIYGVMSSTIEAVFNKFINDAPAYIGDIWREYGDDKITKLAASITTFIVATAPIYDVVRGDGGDVIFETYGIDYRFGDLAAGYLNTFLLGQNAVAHRFVYGSHRFAKRVEQLDEDSKERLHNDIIHQLAPNLYYYLSAINLVTNHIDDRFSKHDILKYLSFRGTGLAPRAKIFTFTGLGSAVGAAMLYGLSTGTLHYLTYGFTSVLLGTRYIYEISMLAKRGDLYSYNAQEIYNTLRSRIDSLKVKYRDLRWELFYGLEEALRDYRVVKLVTTQGFDLVDVLRLD